MKKLINIYTRNQLGNFLDQCKHITKNNFKPKKYKMTKYYAICNTHSLNIHLKKLAMFFSSYVLPSTLLL